jgi:Carboxypeptidase regulatory-like domain/TonB dependent receptor
MFTRTLYGRSVSSLLLIAFLFAGAAWAQSTGTITGTVTDQTGSVIPNAAIAVKNQATGESRTTATDDAGIYLVPSLPVGKYRIEVKASGMQPLAATDLDVSVSSTVRQDFTLNVSTATEIVEIHATAPVLEASSVSVGDVVNQKTVQEIPLNGRHFVDLALLVPGTVTPPANGFLTAPLRGQGAFSFVSAGARETSVNFMVNGINLNDPNQNQITFQPPISTIEEFKIDNQTFSAEYGRNSGSIMNMATRAGANQWHGDLYEFARNNALDARNFTNPVGLQLMAPFIRNQFGGDGGGAIKKNKIFIFLSNEWLRQRQAVPLGSTVLTAAQRILGQASDAQVQSLLPLIPLANSGANGFVGSAVAPVNIEQGTANFSWAVSDAHRINVYYAIQRDERNEPPTTDGNAFPGMGDQRNGQRQIMTFNETWTVTPSAVNEFRAGYSRIHIVFAADLDTPSSQFGINNGGQMTIPQISVTGIGTFGGISGFPQGRGDDLAAISDTLSWVKGKHSIKYGGEVRRQNTDNFSATPGTFSFPSVNAFLADQPSSFTSNTGNRSNRTYENTFGLFITDTWKMTPTLTATLGVRYDYFGSPTEAAGRQVIFDIPTDSLLQIGKGNAPGRAYNASNSFQPRVGLAWDPFKKGRTVIRAAFAIMTDQPTLGLGTNLAGNPPFAVPVSLSSTTSNFNLGNAFSLASGGNLSISSIAQNYKVAYVNEYNLNIQQQFGDNFAVTAGYYGSKGTDLNIAVDLNEPLNGVLPFQKLSASSPIDPGVGLSHITQYESVGNSNYNGLWITAKRRLAKGLQLDTSYTFSKSIDYNSQFLQGVVVQDSRNIRNDRGLSDFDARNRFVISGIYELPFHGNRLKDGWQISLVETAQSGNPLNFHISTTTLTNGLTTVRPNVTGPVVAGYTPAYNLSASAVGYVQNPQVFFDQGATGFGTLGRNVITGPGFQNLDFSLFKNTRIREGVSLEIRADAFDIFNHANFTNPVLTDPVLGAFAPATNQSFSLITGGTRAPAGDAGSSRQFQLAMKLHF